MSPRQREIYQKVVYKDLNDNLTLSYKHNMICSISSAPSASSSASSESSKSELISSSYDKAVSHVMQSNPILNRILTPPSPSPSSCGIRAFELMAPALIARSRASRISCFISPGRDAKGTASPEEDVAENSNCVARPVQISSI